MTPSIQPKSFVPSTARGERQGARTCTARPPISQAREEALGLRAPSMPEPPGGARGRQAGVCQGAGARSRQGTSLEGQSQARDSHGGWGSTFHLGPSPPPGAIRAHPSPTSHPPGPQAAQQTQGLNTPAIPTVGTRPGSSQELPGQL